MTPKINFVDCHVWSFCYDLWVKHIQSISVLFMIKLQNDSPVHDFLELSMLYFVEICIIFLLFWMYCVDVCVRSIAMILCCMNSLGFGGLCTCWPRKILTTQVCIVKSGPSKIPLAKYKTAVTPVCWQQSYHSLVLSHQYWVVHVRDLNDDAFVSTWLTRSPKLRSFVFMLYVFSVSIDQYQLRLWQGMYWLRAPGTNLSLLP